MIHLAIVGFYLSPTIRQRKRPATPADCIRINWLIQRGSTTIASISAVNGIIPFEDEPDEPLRLCRLPLW